MTTEPQGNGHGETAGILDKLNLDEAEQVIEETREAALEALSVASDFIRERPILCLAGALALGYVVGKLVSR
jgi:hypothetical protein